jgi:hypothetical protein
MPDAGGRRNRHCTQGRRSKNLLVLGPFINTVALARRAGRRSIVSRFNGLMTPTEKPLKRLNFPSAG